MIRGEQEAWTWWKTTAAGGLVITSLAGGTFLFDGVPRPIWLVALNMFVVGVAAVLVSAIGAWLGHGQPAARDLVPTLVPAPGDVPLARLVFVVRRDREDFYAKLRATFAMQVNVEVVIDRRDRPRDVFDREVVHRGWSVTRVAV